MFDGLSRLFGIPLTWSYELVGSYAVAIAMVTVLVMLLITPLTLKSTKGMLEMQRLQPELKRLQAEHRGDRQRLNEEMMKLYQEHKVNPLASCLPLLAQMPVFIGMFHLLRGLTQNKTADGFFIPRFVDEGSRLYRDLSEAKAMRSFGLDLAKSPSQVISENLGLGLVYALLVLGLAFLYWIQQRMIANRTVNPSMSAGQQKLLQYLPVAFAVFQLFFPTGLVIYYTVQSVLRIGQQAYITRRFYGGDHSLGRQAQAASQAAREMGTAAKKAPPAKGAKADSGSPPAKSARPSRPAKPAPGGSAGSNARRAPSKPAPKKAAGPGRAGGSGTGRTGRPAPPAGGGRPGRPPRPTKPSK